MKHKKIFAPLVLSLLITACGGGSSDSVTEPVAPPAAAPPAAAAPPPAANVQTLTGQFLDSAVAGMAYTTETQSGATDANGNFSYVPGENITFSIGDIDLPTVPASALMTPLSVFSTDQITDVRVMNLARLLQTLDADANPDNGILLTDSAQASAGGLSVDFASPAFDNQVVNLVANSGSTNVTLVEGLDALEHLQETLFDAGIQERPPAITESAMVNAASTAGATHPLVGRSAEFSTIAHEVSGTMTVLDDRTIEISNFNYDGLGVEVIFYYGTDGDYRSGGAIGPELTGTRFVNETFTLTLPDNLTLDDFNGLSVWCVPFNANFGDAQL